MSVSTTVPWQGLATVPRAPVSATVARLIFERAVSGLPLRVRYPDGREIGRGAAGSPVFELVRPAAFFARVGRDRKIGFGDSYVAGDWRPAAGTDLAELLTVFAEQLTSLVPHWLQRLRAVVDKPIPAQQDNSIDGSRANIAAHYDLSNEMFATFLDPTMSYSSAWFDEDAPVDEAIDLEAAQVRKIDAILDLAGVRDGTQLLEIGSGWGALAIRAGQRGARVTSITLSREQRQLAQERVAAVGLGDAVEIRVQDYRDVRGSFDAIVSVEMIEAVGEAYWPDYFTTLDRLLAPGGAVGLQAITMAHDRVLATRRSFGWIQKYIFPGGLIPSLQAIDDNLAAHTTLQVVQGRELRPHYARTLRLWRQRFINATPQLRGQGFDETFSRMWEFYLAYSEAGFRSGYLGVSQLKLVRTSA